MLLKDTPGQIVIADKGYDAQTRVVQPLLDKGKEVIIASRSTAKQPRECDRHPVDVKVVAANYSILKRLIRPARSAPSLFAG